MYIFNLFESKLNSYFRVSGCAYISALPYIYIRNLYARCERMVLQFKSHQKGVLKCRASCIWH